MKARRRTIFKVIALLAAGAALNVAVAWGLAFFVIANSFDKDLRETGGVMDGPRYGGWIVFRDSRLGSVRIISRWFDAGRSFGVGGGWPDEPAAPLIPGWATMLSADHHLPCMSYHNTVGWEHGWPMRSFGGAIDVFFQKEGGYRVETSFAVPLESALLTDPNKHWHISLLVYRPLWPGFAINTVFYAGVLWVLFCGPFALRRMIRRRRGQCPHCAYPIGQNERCSECGAAVTLKAAMSAG